ncbi:thioesterase family protein [Pseudonocardia sp. TRM90224]|uniref:thioesterase family protein n=1 Tax=Pseudonocardia sp. TRM90224 TaxID=2812678 RepID=UPI001E2C0068|nr:thioesterase family protein [Pseudonocardia sp. TRM90224]
MDAFYLPVSDGVFDSTVATESPWGHGLQHGGPPSALLAYAIETYEPRPDMAIGRISMDFLGPIPQGRITVTTEVLRPGRRVELAEATLVVDGRTAVVARAWRIGTAAGAATPVPAQPATPTPLPPPQDQAYLYGVDPSWGYGRAIEWRFAKGSYAEPGPATVWARPRIPLVADAPTSGLQRTLTVADSINGVSAELKVADWLFIPPSLTVTVHREPEGDWILLDATTTVAAVGTGMAHATLSDTTGEFGVATQPLLVQRR